VAVKALEQVYGTKFAHGEIANRACELLYISYTTFIHLFFKTREKTLYIHCLVLVGSRNGFESGF
jgi:hypothetical protein